MTHKRYRLPLFFILLLLLLAGVNASGQQASRKDSLQNDFNLLRNKLQHDYPSLYRYSSKATMMALFDSCYATLQDTTSNVTFFKTLKFLVSQIRDGHLSCSPSRELRQYLAAQKAYFPFRIRFINNKAYIYRGADNGLQPGTEILAINNTPVNQIKNTLFQYIASDGHIETKKNYILGNYFYIYYFLAFGGKPHFDISYKTANGSISTQRVAAVQELALPPVEDDSKENNLLNLTITPDHIALLTIQTFNKATLDEAGLDFENFLRTAFTTIKDQRIKKLVIDLRGNGGGRDLYGSLLYSYLTSSTFHYYKSLTTATSQLPFDQLKRGATSFNDLQADLLVKANAGTYQLKQEAHNNLQEISPAVNNYTGQVWFLINGLSFSTTAELCAIARSNKRGKFVGEETGGAYEGNTSGVQMDIILPATQIAVSYGAIQYELAVKPVTPTGRGTIPDYPVLPAIEHLLNKQDLQLERALTLAKTGK